VLELKESLTFLDSIAMEEITEDLPEMRNAKLGTIQSSYSIFLKAYRVYMDFVQLDYHQRKIQTARSELKTQQEYTRSLSTMASTQQEAYDLASRQFERDYALIEDKVISDSDLEASRKAVLAESNKYQEIISKMAQNNISIARTENQIMDLKLRQQEENSGMISGLEEAYNNLKASISSWEQNFLLVATVSGSVNFTKFWSENQNVKAGEKVLTIIPAESGSLVGKISLPLAGAGKVKNGNQVNIQFDNYPHLEYGMVEGNVSNISEVPEEGFYTVEVEFPNGLLTYYKFEINASQNMQGNAQIMTDKKRLILRVLEPIRSAISKQVEM
jgi:HlyD family secretion protein